MSKIYKDKFHYEALKKSTVAIFDSGMFCILLFIFKRLCVKKFSGYLFLNKLTGVNKYTVIKDEETYFINDFRKILLRDKKINNLLDE